MKLLNTRSIRFVVLFLVLIAYLPTLGAYFQQDEWIAFGNALARGNFSLLNLFSFSFAPNVGHYVPFHHILFGLLFKLFGLSFTKWMILSICWHLVTTYVVGLLLFKLLKNNLGATLGMLLFGLSGAAHQATTWVVADINTHGSTFFGLLAILSFIVSLDSVKKQKSLLALSMGFVVVSLLFKETTIGLFASIPAIYLLLNKKTNLGAVFTKSRMWILGGVLYVLARVLMFMLPGARETASVVTATQSIGTIIYNLVTFPAKALSQSLIPFEVWLPIGKKIGRFPAKLMGIELNTSRYDLFVQSQLLEITFITIFIGAVMIAIYLHRKFENYYTRLALFAIYFVCANSVIFAFSPERSGVITFIDSRNLYLTLFGSILFIFSLLELINRKRLKLIATLTLLALIILNSIVLFSVIKSSVAVGQVRRSILERVDTVIPPSDRVAIYIKSDSSYYGLPGEKQIVPFQSGFGQTLLVYLHDRYNFPPEFYADYFLWPIYSEGYINNEKSSFGFFNQYQSLSTLVKNGFPLEKIYALQWYSRTETFVDITEETRKQLMNISK